MPNQDYYKIYSTKYLPEISKVYCIITGVELENAGKFYSEYYIFIPKQKRYFGLISEAQREEILGFELNLEYLFQSSKEMVIGKLDNYVYELLKDKNHALYLDTKFDLTEVKIFEMLDILNGDDFKSFINEIRTNSKSNKLKNDISFIWNNKRIFIKKREL